MRQYAFFDADETLIPFKTMFEFKRFLTWQLMEKDHAKAAAEDSRFRQQIHQMATTLPREEINRFYYSGFAGLKAEYLFASGRLWYQQLKRANIRLFIQPVLDLMAQWHANNIEPVLVSGSADFILQPFCQELGISRVLCSRLQQQNGVFNGQLTGQPVIGNGKAIAMRAFAQQRQLDLATCYAVGDHVSDFPMLETAGQAYVVSNGNQDMVQAAQGKGWRVIHTPVLQAQTIQFL